MQARMSNPAVVIPGAMAAIQGLFKATGKSGVPSATLELVHLRASQINGCSACVDSGARSAKKAGETDERLFPVSAPGHRDGQAPSADTWLLASLVKDQAVPDAARREK